MIKIRYHKQQGAALAISLILLVAMTILGVANLNGSRLAEKVSSNAQQKTIVYETAESVLDAIHSDVNLQDRLDESRMLAKINPPPVQQISEAAAIEQELDQSNVFGTSVDVNAYAEIQFCLEMPREGDELGDDKDARSSIGFHYDIRAESTIDNSRAKAAHVLRVETGGFPTDSTGDCVTPGT